MPRRDVVFVQGEYYHVYNRGALKQPLFHKSESYYAFLDYIHRFAEKFGVIIVAFCLMPNHFHLLLRCEKEGDVSEFMCQVCHTFSRRINKLLKRSGTAFEGRFKAKHVQDDSYFRQLCAYIHANPVKAGLVEHPAKWSYSSFNDTVGSKFNSKYDVAPIIASFGSRVIYEQAVVSTCAQPQVRDEKLTRSLGEMGLL